MTLPSVTDYTDLITSYHAGKPKFVATVGLSVQAIADLLAVIAGFPHDFDLDYAIGAQLDAVGEWAGISRYITVPLDTPWFSFGNVTRGFGQGIWKGPLSPTTGISPLDDDTYRDLIRAKIAANAWDGSFSKVKPILDIFFLSRGVNIFVEDRQDMSLNFGVFGDAAPSLIMLSIMAGFYIPLKPVGVRTKYVVSSVSNTPIFGFGANNSKVAGFGTGSWGTSPSALLGI